MEKISDVITGFLNFLGILYHRKHLILEMAKRDVMAQYMGSVLGFILTFVNPVVMIFILWFVFKVGFKTAPKGGVPFVVWMTAGMSIWNTFNEVMLSSTNSIIGNPHLVKKVVFPLGILPVVKLVGSFITHGIFLMVLVLLCLLNGLPFSFFWLQAIYYFAAMSMLVLGLSWATSAINVFARDTTQVVNVLLQIGFWSTPIFWDIDIMPAKAQVFLKLNPMFYIVQGYRDSFVYHIPFWQHWEMALYFWGMTALVFAIGAAIFLRLRPHFADVL
jgi:lipopolysaccharide transport system permease protein